MQIADASVHRCRSAAVFNVYIYLQMSLSSVCGADNLCTYCCYGATEVRVVKMVTGKLVSIHRLSASVD